MVTKKEATILQSEVALLLDRLSKSEYDQLDAEITSLAIKIRDQFINQHGNNIDTPVLNSLNINSKNDYKLSISQEVFPMLNELTSNAEQTRFVEKVDLSNKKSQLLKEVQIQYLSILQSLEENIKNVIENDKHWLLRIFMSGKTKTALKTSKAFIKKYQSKLIDIRNKLDVISSATVENGLSQLNFNNNPSKYYEKLKEKIQYYEQPPIYLIYSRIEKEVPYLEEKFEQLDLEKVDQKILSTIEDLKKSQVPKTLKTLPIDYLETYLKQDIDLAQLKTKYSNVSELTNVFIEEILDDFEYTLEEAFHIKEAVNDLTKNLMDTFQPRINLDEIDVDDENLVRLIMYRQRIQELSRLQNEEYEPIFSKLVKTAILFRDVYKNEYHYTQIEGMYQLQIQMQKKDLLDSYTKLLPFLEKLNKLRTPESISSKEVLEFFEENSATFYATLEQLTGVKDTSSSSMPTFIKDAIDDQVLDHEGLSEELTLRPYQEFGTKFALYNKRTLLGDEMGLGKTIQAIAFINHLFNQGLKRAIVVSPLSVLANWKREINRWSRLDTVVFRGNKRRSAFRHWKNRGGILLTNFEQSKYLIKAGAEELLDIIIVDEAHFIKNPKAMRSRNTNQLAKAAEYAIFMTGTPLENRVDEMKQLVSVLQPEFSENIEGFGETYDPDEFKEMVSTVYLRRKRDEVLKELPKISYVHLWSDFSAVEQTFYDEAVISGLSGLMRMRRAGFYGKTPSRSGKIAQLVEIIEEAKENGHKVLIFSYFKTDVLNMLDQLLNEYSVGVISGDVSNTRRQELIDEFTTTEEKNILLSQIDAGGVGLNIQAANIVVLCEPQWRPSTEKQAIGRVYRMGQTRNVIVYRLLTEDSVDERILDLLGHKTDIFNAYAHDSLVADTFRQIQKGEEVSESELTKKVYEIEKLKVEQRIKLKQTSLF